MLSICKLDFKHALLEHIIVYVKTLELQEQNQMLNLTLPHYAHVFGWWQTMPEGLQHHLIDNNMAIINS